MLNFQLKSDHFPLLVAYNARILFSQIKSHYFVSSSLELSLARLMSQRNISVAHVSTNIVALIDRMTTNRKEANFKSNYL